MNLDFLNKTMPSLASGGHEEGSGQLCAMELVAFIEREEHSDRPSCTCPVLAAYTRSWNDSVPDHLRNHILPLLPQLVGTRNEEYQTARAEYFAFAARDSACEALEGKIDPTLIEKLRNAKTLDECRDCAKDCRDAACATAAYAAAAAYATAAACAAADACAAVAAAYAADQVWLDALETLKGAIAIDPDHSPATWTEQDYARGAEVMA